MFKSRCLDFIAIVALFSGPTASAADRSFIGGNDGGTFDRIAVSPDDSQVVYVGISGERTTPTGIFIDVPVSSFADGFIEQLAAEGITGGCGHGNFCPDKPITRAQMAVFLVRTFGL